MCFYCLLVVMLKIYEEVSYKVIAGFEKIREEGITFWKKTEKEHLFLK